MRNSTKILYDSESMIETSTANQPNCNASRSETLGEVSEDE